jgi:hypothetical protein
MTIMKACRGFGGAIMTFMKTCRGFGGDIMMTAKACRDSCEGTGIIPKASLKLKQPTSIEELILFFLLH